jgi:hypothetical protein
MLDFTKIPLRKWANRYLNEHSNEAINGEIILFIDEFSDFQEVEKGRTVIKLLHRLGYQIDLPTHGPSARPLISKGFLKEAKSIVTNHVKYFNQIVSAERPLVGIEPSAILGFRDDFRRLIPPELDDQLDQISRNTYTIEEFLYREFSSGKFDSSIFDSHEREIVVHGHCHQKSLTNLDEVAWLLSIPQNHKVDIIPSGCCGMAGSFGYGKEHFEFSQKIAELVLFPYLRDHPNALICAPGTSCRHQIHDGLNRMSYNTAELLLNAMI